MRGRAFAFVMLLCVTWTTARIMFLFAAEQGSPQRQYPGRLLAKQQLPTAREDTIQPALEFQIANAPKRGTSSFADVRNPATIGHAQAASPSELVTDFPRTVEYQYDALPIGSVTPSQIYIPITTKLIPFDGYAYSFWRSGAAAAGQLGNGQYGGGQSAIIIAVPVLRFDDAQHTARLAVMSRLSTSHGKIREREWAAGLRWQPVKSIPAQLTVERRFRPDRPDAFAAYIAGGQAGRELPFAFKLDGYGQAGFVRGADGGAFVDVQLAADRRLASQGHATLFAGAGVWGGGNWGDELGPIMRVDMGPSMRVSLPAGPALLRADVSWRFRVAGDVQPGNGPALTLSTSF